MEVQLNANRRKCPICKRVHYHPISYLCGECLKTERGREYAAIRLVLANYETSHYVSNRTTRAA